MFTPYHVDCKMLIRHVHVMIMCKCTEIKAYTCISTLGFYIHVFK